MSNHSTAAHTPIQFDFIVVGGGTSGCVMASRLSENGKYSVMLIEAGQDSDVDWPDSPLLDASRLVLAGYNWQYEANVHGADRFSRFVQADDISPVGRDRRKQFGYSLGKVMGGSSAINGAVALRAFPSDFECWVKMGCEKWSWQDVLPWYKFLENDCDRQNPSLHGHNGPLRLRRPGDAEILPLEKAFSVACQDHGIPFVDDLNEGEGPAVGAVPANVVQGVERFDLYRAYLSTARERKNLHLLTNVMVERVLFSASRATGVEVTENGEQTTYQAEQVVLCAGAVGSAAILQRSGVGDGRLLHKLDIPVVADLPAVGKSLSDHASVVLWALPRIENSITETPWRQTAARLSSGYDAQIDVQLGLMNNVASRTVPGFQNRTDYPRLVGASVMLMRPNAKGRVFIQSKSSQQLPLIDLPLSKDPEDIARLVGGVRKMWQLINHPEVVSYLDGIQFWSNAMINNDDIMYNAVKNLVSPGWHASGTIRMGSENDPDTAADEKGNLHGLSHITVADASLFPVIPSLPTNLTTVMVAERIASFLLERNV
ncbi:Oxygen-dependent choline dehydrogenase [Photorhabdus australis subsp. thailandensis]|uniref:Oxygen-dependent choline dehydrogenase n=1 Tax=Photorhabdus australis subsp. thailandensis TaxID=2805096 RepID=A0A1C0U3N9_9GAMM|nr:GMC family oxidoreductase [Photorhabdus australis]OCQ52511.1 Oxygen-dependent choline dehydrogenase [Photorhabdus australis subsp. thailandensis]